jgi:HD-GYP domain-containing protein (c-di-GMP phosphodiesterase class II)
MSSCIRKGRFELAKYEPGLQSALGPPAPVLRRSPSSPSLNQTSTRLEGGAIRQARSYRVARLSSQANLIAAFVLLAGAAAAMILFRVWTYGWWYYHLLMLAAVALAFRALLFERAQGKSLRSVLDAALELEVSVDYEQVDVEVVAALVAAVEVKDRETQGHNRRVAELCVKIGRELCMTASEQRVLARAGLVHDVGKLGIPDAILHKHGALNASEWKVMKTHPEVGVSILGRAGHLKRELLAVLYHHERMDGSGYPHGLIGEAIPIEARIVAVADTYDVVTSERPYRKARSRADARCILEAESAAHLDPNVVAAVLKILDKETRNRESDPAVELTRSGTRRA